MHKTVRKLQLKKLVCTQCTDQVFELPFLGGFHKSLGCDTNILFKAHLAFWKLMWMWRTAKLVQGGYIPSAFHPTTRILSQMPTIIAMFVCLANS